MIIAVPPAVHAPATPCANNAANPADHVGTLPTYFSPDCRWRLDFKVVDSDGNDCYMQLYLRAPLSRRRLYSYCSETANVFLHWLGDGRAAVFNVYDGADSAEPYVMILDGQPRHAPLNLAAILGRDFERRVKIDPKRFVYHFYASYEHETPDGIEVSLREDDAGDQGGAVMTRCFTYHFLKPAYRRYKLISRIGPVDMDKAPCDGFAADRK